MTVLSNTMDFIYRNCSSRISERIEALELSNRSIYQAESKIIGRIRRCQITEKRNPYLIQDNVRDCLKEKLQYNSYQDMLWGTYEEITEYLPTLFLLLITDLIHSSSPYKETINDVLCNYVPYAKYLGYFHIIYGNDDLVLGYNPVDLYGVDERDLLMCIDSYFAKAVDYLYRKCNSAFLEIYLEFVSKNESFKRWNYKFIKWIEDSFLPLIKEYIPTENSFGVRIRQMINSDYKYVSTFLLTSDPNEIDAIKMLLSSTAQYINQLEKIQATYPDYDFSH